MLYEAVLGGVKDQRTYGGGRMKQAGTIFAYLAGHTFQG